MKISLVYVYSVIAGERYDNYAFRFLESYHANPPGIEHETVVVLNGIKESSACTCLFSPLQHCSFLEHDNSGFDIGAFQHAARECPCDMMLFLGSSTFFTRPGWLIRMATAFQKHGHAQYGATGNRGNPAAGVWPHIRTTAFWMDPKLMNSYPVRVTRPDQRYPFEHHRGCFTDWVTKLGLKSWVITWGRDLLWEDWDSDPQGFHHGNQSSVLARDRVCE